MELNIIYFVFSRKCNRLTAPKLLTNVPPSKVPNRNTPIIFPNTPTEIPKYPIIFLKYPHYFSQIPPLELLNTPTIFLQLNLLSQYSSIFGKLLCFF